MAFIDDFSQYVPGWALDDTERADAVIAAFEAAVARHGKPEAVMRVSVKGFSGDHTPEREGNGGDIILGIFFFGRFQVHVPRKDVETFRIYDGYG